ncbi:MAG: hypothetical protein IJ306_07930, partial [Oscillospiraceae bacterium]|nr:hypothetical protein [Oscillospiraceae bacterium]
YDNLQTGGNGIYLTPQIFDLAGGRYALADRSANKNAERCPPLDKGEFKKENRRKNSSAGLLL